MLPYPRDDGLMTEDNDPNLHILQAIEDGLVVIYADSPSLTDANVVFALDIGKIAIKQVYGFAKSQNGVGEPQLKTVVQHVVKTGQRLIGKDLTLDDYVKCVDKVKRSVERHRSYGIRGYYEFIQQFL